MTSERTSIDENEVEHLDNISPRKVNIDVLKLKIHRQEKKKKIQSNLVLFCLFVCVCAIGFLTSV